MKKIMALVAVIATVFVFSACGNTSTVVDTSSTENEAQSTEDKVSSSSEEDSAALPSTGKRVYCSSEVKNGFMPAINVNDGDDGTSWSSDTTTEVIDEWIAIDLGENYDLESVTLKWGMSRAVDYSIEISRGGVEYTEVYSKEGVTSIDDETVELSGTARYIRLRCKKVPSVLGAYMGATVKELEVNGEVSEDQTLGSETEMMVITKTVVPTADDVLRGGRSYEYNELCWAGSTYEYQCTGVAAGAVITGASGIFEVSVDGGEYQSFEIKNGTFEYLFTDKLDEGTHTVRILRRSDPWNPKFTVESVIVESTADIVKGYKGDYDFKIEFIGDSITSGQGVHYHECYTTKTAELLNAHFQVVSRAGMGLYRNAGNSTGETLPEQYQWTEYHGKRDKPYTYRADVVVLNIGTNDGGSLSRYVEGKEAQEEFVKEFERCYTEMLDEILVANPNAKIVCVYGQLGKNTKIEETIKKVVEEYKKAHAGVVIEYMPFQHAFDATEETDGHPGPASHERDAKQLAEKIKELLD